MLFYLVSLLFATLLSLNLITFNIFFLYSLESYYSPILVTVVPVDKTYVAELNQSFVQQSE